MIEITPTERRHRAAFLVALVGSALPFAITHQLAGQAVEHNPVTSTLINMMGWFGFALLIPLITVGIFRVFAYTNDEYPRITAIGVSAVVGISLANSINDLYVATILGVEWTHILIETAAISTPGIALLTIPSRRSLSHVDLQTVVAPALSLLLVLSMMTGFLFIGTAPTTAATDGELLDDFEDGIDPEWEYGSASPGIDMTQKSSAAYEGEFGAEFYAAGSGNVVRYDFVSDNYAPDSFQMKYQYVSGTSSIEFVVRGTGDGVTSWRQLSGSAVNDGDWYNLQYRKINSSTAYVNYTTLNGSVASSITYDISGLDSVTGFRLRSLDTSTWNGDFLEVNGGPTNEIAGYVTDRDGAPITNATVDIVGVDYENIVADATQTKRERATELIQEAKNPIPDDFTRTLDVTSEFLEGGSQVVPLISESDEIANARLGDAKGGVTQLENPQFEPRVVLPADEPLGVYAWDPTQQSNTIGGLLNGNAGAYNGQINPGVAADVNEVEMERLGPEGDVIETIPVELNTKVGSGISPVDLSSMVYGEINPQPGFYRLSVLDNKQQYIVAVGKPDALGFVIERQLKNEAGDKIQAAKQISGRFNTSKFTKRQATTNETGYYQVSAPVSLKTASISAYKSPTVDLTQIDPTTLDLTTDVSPNALAREYARQNNERVSLVSPVGGSTLYAVPNTQANVTLATEEIKPPKYSPSNKSEALREFLEAEAENASTTVQQGTDAAGDAAADTVETLPGPSPPAAVPDDNLSDLFETRNFWASLLNQVSNSSVNVSGIYEENAISRGLPRRLQSINDLNVTDNINASQVNSQIAAASATANALPDSGQSGEGNLEQGNESAVADVSDVPGEFADSIPFLEDSGALPSRLDIYDVEPRPGDQVRGNVLSATVYAQVASVLDNQNYSDLTYRDNDTLKPYYYTVYEFVVDGDVRAKGKLKPGEHRVLSPLPTDEYKDGDTVEYFVRVRNPFWDRQIRTESIQYTIDQDGDTVATDPANASIFDSVFGEDEPAPEYRNQSTILDINDSVGAKIIADSYTLYGSKTGELDTLLWGRDSISGSVSPNSLRIVVKDQNGDAIILGEENTSQYSLAAGESVEVTNVTINMDDTLRESLSDPGVYSLKVQVNVGGTWYSTGGTTPIGVAVVDGDSSDGDSGDGITDGVSDFVDSLETIALGQDELDSVNESVTQLEAIESIDSAWPAQGTLGTTADSNATLIELNGSTYETPEISEPGIIRASVVTGDTPQNLTVSWADANGTTQSTQTYTIDSYNESLRLTQYAQEIPRDYENNYTVELAGNATVDELEIIGYDNLAAPSQPDSPDEIQDGNATAPVHDGTRTVVANTINPQVSINRSTLTENTSTDSVSGVITTDGDLSPDTILLANLESGATFQVAEQYYGINQRPLQGDQVVVSGLPIVDNRTLASLTVLDVNEDGTRDRITEPVDDVTRPPQAAQPPEVTSIDVSSLYPAVGLPATAVVETPEGPAQIANATVYTPEGTINPQLNGNQIVFDLVTPGRHTVVATIEDNNETYKQRVRLQATGQGVAEMGEVRLGQSALGSYGIAGRKVDTARVDINGDAADIAVKTTDPDLSRLQVATGDVKVSEYRVSVVDAQSSQALNRRLAVEIPVPVLSDALVRRGGTPITADGTSAGVIDRRDDGSAIIRTYTGPQGSVRVDINRNPSFVERTMFTVKVLLDNLPF